MRTWKTSQRVTLRLSLQVEEHDLGQRNIIALISVLGGMWQIMFTQGDQIISLKKKIFKVIQEIHVLVLTIISDELSPKLKDLPEVQLIQ